MSNLKNLNEPVTAMVSDWLNTRQEDIKSKEDWDKLLVLKLLSSHFHPSFAPSKKSMLEAVEAYHQLAHYVKTLHYKDLV